MNFRGKWMNQWNRNNALSDVLCFPTILSAKQNIVRFSEIWNSLKLHYKMLWKHLLSANVFLSQWQCYSVRLAVNLSINSFSAVLCFLTCDALNLLPDIGVGNYTCPEAVMRRSEEIPTNVNSVRPADIKVVMAMGDSLTVSCRKSDSEA